MTTERTESATATATGPNTAPPAPSGAAVHIDPVGSLRAHRFLAVCVFLGVLLLGLPLAYFKGAPQYSASAVIFVSPRFLANLQDDNKETELQSNSQYREYVQQQVRTINRYDIVENALKSVGPARDTFMTKGETTRHAVERLQGALDIAPVPDTYQVTVTLQGTKKDGLATIVNAVVQSFLELSKTEEFYASDKRIVNLSRDEEKLRNEIAQEQDKRTELAQELGVTTFTENFLNPYDKLLVDAKSAAAEAMRNRIYSDASLASLDQKQRPDGGKALEAMAQDLASHDTSLTTLQANVNQRRAALLSMSSGMLGEHPGRKAAERELADLQKECDATYQRLLSEYSGMLMEQRKADAFKTSAIEGKLANQVKEQESMASWFTSRYQQGLALGLDIDRARKRLNSIEDRVDFLSLEAKAPGFVRLFSPARVPDVPVKGGRTKLFAIVGVLGMLLGLIAPVAVDFLDPRLFVPASAEAVLGFPLMGWLLRKDEAGKDFAREQVFRLASRIIQDRQVHNTKIFAFTAIKAGSGTTSIVTDTALALTRLGAPTLAVEANAYRADARYRHPNARGLAVVLRGSHSIQTAVIPGNNDFPDFIPVGDIDNQRNLPDVMNLIGLLKDSAQVYDFVLLDLPPLMVSADAEILARSADVTVLVIEAGTTTKGELKQTARALERLHPKAAAAIMNKVSAEAGGGFGKRALHEFRTGTLPAPPKWATPWLWR